MSAPNCIIPADDREKLLRLLKRLQEFHTPDFKSLALAKHAQMIKESIKLLEDETIKAGVAEFRKVSQP